MSKKTLIILLAIVIIGVLVIVIAGQRAEYTDEPVVPIDDNDAILDNLEPYAPVEDDIMIPEVPITEEELEEEVMEEGLLE